jgi:hypothetical protein
MVLHASPDLEGLLLIPHRLHPVVPQAEISITISINFNKLVIALGECLLTKLYLAFVFLNSLLAAITTASPTAFCCFYHLISLMGYS